MALDIAAIQPHHLPAAAALFCDRCRSLRGSLPALPSRYDSPAEILPRLQELLAGLPGVAAFSHDRLVGCLLAFELTDFIGKRSAYSPEWANAAELESSARIYAELYAAASAFWLEAGCAQHVLTLLANDHGALNSFYRLGFGMVTVDSIRGLASIESPAAPIHLRRAGAADLPQVRCLTSLLKQHLVAAPIFWQHALDDPAAWLDDPQSAVWLALQDGAVIGGMGIGPSREDTAQIVQDASIANIFFAYTLQGARRSGVATILLARCLDWAKEQGYTRCSVDYESANLSAAGFWGRWFMPAAYSLLRRIDDRLIPEEKLE
jgi:GNAT superfamily N-acetyltransferase